MPRPQGVAGQGGGRLRILSSTDECEGLVPRSARRGRGRLRRPGQLHHRRMLDGRGGPAVGAVSGTPTSELLSLQGGTAEYENRPISPLRPRPRLQGDRAVEEGDRRVQKRWTAAPAARSTKSSVLHAEGRVRSGRQDPRAGAEGAAPTIGSSSASTTTSDAVTRHSGARAEGTGGSSASSAGRIFRDVASNSPS